jgi:predicted ferric reductase
MAQDHRLESASLSKLPDQNISWKQWTLSMIVLASISWVILFSTLATHSDAIRDTIYPAMQTKYFDEKSGALVFTYLVVFYLFSGTVTYCSLYFGIRIPKPSPWLVRTLRVSKHSSPTFIEAGAFATFCITLVATCVARIMQRFEFGYWPPERYIYEVSKTLGKAIALTLLVLLFPISKKCFWWDLFNFQFERAVKLHRWLAWLLVWLVILHAITAIAALFMVEQFQTCMLPNENCEKPGGWGNWDGLEISRVYTYGWIAFVIAIPLVLTSLSWVRRRHFEVFYYTHSLFIPFFILLHFHFPNMVYYLAPGFSAYILDKVVWFYVSRRPTKLKDLSIPAHGYVRITIELPGNYMYEPGAWVQIKVPIISAWEWHPMSVASAPGHSTITIDVKVIGNWTQKLAKLAADFDPTRPSHTCIFVDRFYGSSHKEKQGYLNHRCCVMFAGGIGVTPMMSAFRSLVEDSCSYPHIQKVILVWCVKKMSCVELYRQELARYQALKILPSGCLVDVIVHVTFSEEENGFDDSMLENREKATNASGGKTTREQMFFEVYNPGHLQRLFLTLGSGFGCLLGIYVANVAAYGMGWRTELTNVLQLVLEVIFSVFFVFSVLVAASRVQITTNEKVKHSDSVMRTKSGRSSAATEMDEDQKQLDLKLKCRPDVLAILNDAKDYCAEHGIPTAGVSVCGPELLVRCVHDKARTASSADIVFVVDEESFDW